MATLGRALWALGSPCPQALWEPEPSKQEINGAALPRTSELPPPPTIHKQ